MLKFNSKLSTKNIVSKGVFYFKEINALKGLKAVSYVKKISRF